MLMLGNYTKQNTLKIAYVEHFLDVCVYEWHSISHENFKLVLGSP